MTNPISSVSQTPPPSSASAPPGAPKSNAQPSAAAPQGDSVTLSTDAQTSTQLLNAARDASGVNPQAVERIRTALQGGNYNVGPDELAQAIATVLKETG